MVSKSRCREGSQEHSRWLFQRDGRRHLRLLFFVELLDFVDHLKTVLLRHLEVEKKQVNRL
jgi:hypothetical protein